MATNAEIVQAAQQLYVSYYGRPADPGGLAFWIESFTETDNVDQALVDFGTSAEFLAIVAANPTTTQLINQLYQFMFNRDADSDGLAFYTDLLDSGAASLASIALDIANGAINEDRVALDNKIEVANTFTAEVESEDASYTASDIPGAQALLATVDDTQASVDAAEAAIPDLVEMMNGFFTLTDDNPVADFSGSSVGVTVVLDGDDSETEFSVIGSNFDDSFLLEEYFKAALTGGTGIDTVDFSDADGAYTVSLDVGTFSADEDGDGLPEFTGTLASIESVIGSDEIDIMNGSDTDERFDGGGGIDTLRGGAGDDTFVYGDETDLATEIADGQTGTDVIEFTGQDVDLTGLATTNVSVESLLLSNMDQDSAVSLRLDDTTGFGPQEFNLITGSSAIDTLTIVGATTPAPYAAPTADFRATSLASIDVLSVGVDLAVKNTTLDEVLTLSGPGGGMISAGARGTYELSGTTLTGWDTLDGVAGDTGVVWVLNQTQIDSLLDDTAGEIFGANMVDVPALTDPNDTLKASGSLDLTRVTGGLNVREIDFGSAGSVEIDETQLGDGLVLVDAASGTLILNDDGDNDIDLNAAGLGIDGVAVLKLQGTLVDLTIGAGASFSGIGSITGSSDDLAVAAATNVILTGSNLAPFDTLTFGATGGSVTLDQTVLDNFDEWGTGLAATDTLAFILGGTSLDLSAVDFDDTFNATTAAVTVTGTDGNDTITEADGDDDAAAMPFTYTLGKGNDTFIGTDKTAITGAITVNGGDGNDAITLGEIDTGNYTVNGDAGDDTLTGDDGDDTLNGGTGDDILIAGAGTNSLSGGDGDDELTAGSAADTLTGGIGDDRFTMAMTQIGLTIADFDSVGTATADQDDLLRLDFNINTTPATAFDSILVNNKLPVLQLDTTVGTGLTGNVVNIGAGNAIGNGTSALQALASTTSARGFISGLATTAMNTYVDTSFVLFAANAGSLVAFIVTDNGPTASITMGEISSVVIALGNFAGDMAEEDLILI